MDKIVDSFGLLIFRDPSERVLKNCRIQPNCIVDHVAVRRVCNLFKAYADVFAAIFEPPVGQAAVRDDFSGELRHGGFRVYDLVIFFIIIVVVVVIAALKKKEGTLILLRVSGVVFILLMKLVRHRILLW